MRTKSERDSKNQKGRKGMGLDEVKYQRDQWRKLWDHVKKLNDLKKLNRKYYLTKFVYYYHIIICDIIFIRKSLISNFELLIMLLQIRR